MASRQVVLLAVAVAVAFLPGLTAAEQYMVGDAAGWTLSYPANWPDGKTFRVGDTLMFMYPAGKHTVYEVDGPTFKNCNTTSNPINSWTSGNDVVPLVKTGRRWFFCSVADHCSKGMKLVVNVGEANAPAPSPALPAPPPSAAVSYKDVGGAAAQAMVAAGAAVVAVLML